MKLMSGRQYKNDISDVAGILQEEQERGKTISLEMIRTAVCNLYDSWDKLPTYSRELIMEIMKDGQLEKLYEQYRSTEKPAKEALIDFEQKYPDVTNIDNVNDIICTLKKCKEVLQQ